MKELLWLGFLLHVSSVYPFLFGSLLGGCSQCSSSCGTPPQPMHCLCPPPPTCSAGPQFPAFPGFPMPAFNAFPAYPTSFPSFPAVPQGNFAPQPPPIGYGSQQAYVSAPQQNLPSLYPPQQIGQPYRQSVNLQPPAPQQVRVPAAPNFPQQPREPQVIQPYLTNSRSRLPTTDANHFEQSLAQAATDTGFENKEFVDDVNRIDDLRKDGQQQQQPQSQQQQQRVETPEEALLREYEKHQPIDDDDQDNRVEGNQGEVDPTHDGDVDPSDQAGDQNPDQNPDQPNYTSATSTDGNVFRTSDVKLPAEPYAPGHSTVTQQANYQSPSFSMRPSPSTTSEATDYAIPAPSPAATPAPFTASNEFDDEKKLVTTQTNFPSAPQSIDTDGSIPAKEIEAFTKDVDEFDRARNGASKSTEAEPDVDTGYGARDARASKYRRQQNTSEKKFNHKTVKKASDDNNEGGHKLKPFETAYMRGAKSVSKCNSARLMQIMHEKMSVSPSISKQMIYSAASEMLPGRNVDVVCSRHSFSYIVVTSPLFCEHRKRPLTCFAFFQP